MVVFTCTHCGDSLQKPKVEKHYQTVCRNVKSLTCVDCLKDFRGEEYSAHTKCVTEAERYAAKGSNVKTVVRKGEVKQESWTELVSNVVANAGNVPASQQRVFDVIGSSTNVPRKKMKFINFIKSSIGGRIKNEDIEAVWDLIEQHKPTQPESIHQAPTTPIVEAPKSQEEATKNHTKKEKQPKTKASAEATTNASNAQSNPKKKKRGSTNIEEDLETSKKKQKSENEQAQDETEVVPKKKKRKSKSDANLETTALNGKANENGAIEKESVNGNNRETHSDNPYIPTQFSYEDNILKVLKKHPVTLEKLQKKVLGSYTKKTGNQASPKTIKKFNKKLKKMSDVEIVNDNVRLIDKV